MKNLKTTYLGIELKNPIIAGACNLSTDVEMAKRIEKSGAGAIVYKSLFEEQIQLDNLRFQLELEDYNDRHAEMTRIFPDLTHAGPQEHLAQFKEVKKNLSIPVFASLNAINEKTWINWSFLLQEAGADGLELNFYQLPEEIDKSADSIENSILKIVSSIKEVVSIPIAVKLSPYYTNVLDLVAKLDYMGVQGFVLFNNLFQPEIDPDLEKHISPYHLSNSGDGRIAIRFAGLLYGNMRGNICTGTGIHTGKDVIKQLLAGADTVQVVSTIYKHHPEFISTILEDINIWMEKKNYNEINDFRGKLSKKLTKDPYTYKRSQYVDILMHSEDILKTHTLV